MKIIFYLSLIAALLISAGCSLKDNEKKVTIRFITSPLQKNERVYIPGNNPQMGDWEPDGTAMEKESDSVWTKTFTYSSGEHIEFKFTRGSWLSEAIDNDNKIFSNFILDVKNDTVISVRGKNWQDKHFAEQNKIEITKELFEKQKLINLSELWRYKKGDNILWADPKYDDNDWEIVNAGLHPLIFPESGWDGLGWFRLKIKIDSIYLDKPLAFYLYQVGASEFYIDGKLVYKFGKVGIDKASEIPFEDRNPKVLYFKDSTEHLLAIRYSNFNWKYFEKFDVVSGFSLIIGNLNETIADRTEEVRWSTIYQMIFVSIPAALALLHFFLYFFYPAFKENIFYSLSLIFFAALVFSDFQQQHATTAGTIVMLARMRPSFIVLSILFLLLTSYMLFKKKLLKLFIIPAVLGIILCILGFFTLDPRVETLMNIFFVVVFAEILRAFFTGEGRYEKSSWIALLGFFLLFLVGLYQSLIDSGTLPSITNSSRVYIYGIFALYITMSIYLSYKFAKVHINLEKQIVQVKELSELTLAQEREAKEIEIQQRVLQADNDRKTRELEESRQLQLSMLPLNLPSINDLDIAVYMQTATEVGGDYYDFYLAQNGALTVVLGDATGHGLKAGTMVTAVKSLFNVLKKEESTLVILNSFNRALKEMNLPKLTMSLSVLKIKHDSIDYASAGMPPLLAYKKVEDCIQEVKIKGMPLGAFDEFPYQMTRILFQKDDVLLLMSDGLPELFNEKHEEFGYDKIKEIFLRSRDKTSQQILDNLKTELLKWSNEKPPNDDITLLVIKKK